MSENFRPDILFSLLADHAGHRSIHALLFQGPCQLEKVRVKCDNCRSRVGRLAEFPTASWEAAPIWRAEQRGAPALSAHIIHSKGTIMLGKILGAIAGEKLAGRNSGARAR